jgi:methionyl aminopeptidase
VIPRRSAADLAAMARAGRVVAEIHDVIRAALRPGVTTGQLDRLARDVLDRRGARSNFLGYHGYPAVICASPNDVVIHGIPGARVLAEGDLISIDCGAIVDGWHADAAFTAGVGVVDAGAARLIEVAERALAAGTAALVPGGRLGDVGAAIEAVVDRAGLALAEGYTGHGIGRAMHEAPDVPNWGRRGSGPRLAEGNTLCLEPMVCAGTDEVRVLADGWTVVTADGGWAAHAEHTVAIGPHGPVILTAS